MSSYFEPDPWTAAQVAAVVANSTGGFSSIVYGSIPMGINVSAIQGMLSEVTYFEVTLTDAPPLGQTFQ